VPQVFGHREGISFPPRVAGDFLWTAVTEK
jgi:hypothetical protein